MHRTIRATQAMIFSSPHTHNTRTSTWSVLQEDNVELALDIYTPAERREYLVKRGNHCHPGSNSGSSSSSSGGHGSSSSNPLMNDEDTTSLQWYDVLSRYDSLMASAEGNDDDISGTSFRSSNNGDASTASSSSKSEAGSTKSSELERMATELFKFCVLYNGDGHAFLGWEEQLLLPFRDVVDVNGNYGVVAMMMDSGDTATTDGMMVTDGGFVPISASSGTGAVGSTGGSYIHESFLSISPYTPATSELSAMIRLLLETSDDALAFRPLMLPRELHRLISKRQENIPNTNSGGAANSDMIDDSSNSEKGDDGNDSGASWTLLRNSCIPLADMVGGGSGSSSSVPIASSSNVANAGLDSQFSSFFVDSSSSSNVGLGAPDAFARRTAARCPLSEGGYCCLTFLPDKSNGESSDKRSGGSGSGKSDESAKLLPVMALRHPVGGWTSGKVGGSSVADQRMPYKLAYEQSKGAVPKSPTDRPLKLGGVPRTDLPYISTVRIVTNNTHAAPASSTTKFPNHPADSPNFFDILFENDCLPYRKECHRCLKDVANEAPPDPDDEDYDSKMASFLSNPTNACSKCQRECPCYCDILCKIRPPPKPVVRTYSVRPPAYRKEVGRLVPKIIHQTWFEPVTKDKYPNMSRLIESWKKSGWEYYFYDDDTAGEFLGMHFPSEVREAYESITPGAFKADLFRYCVLLIRGGVYADMDVLLQTNLDDAIAKDVGFMTPIDEPGIQVGHRSCLWNGLIASAPGHPFLARTIEIVVNNIRNRFTAVDYDDMLCPNPILSVSHTVDTLFTCGPCILGAGINNLLGRHMQTEFEIGDVDVWQTERSREAGNVSKGNGGKASIRPDDPRLLIPGRTVILEQNKNDMGAHRFTWAGRHLIIAATDMPDYDDRPPTKEHYSKTHEKAGVYGMRKLYTDTKRANEEIRIVVEK